ncbi:MAG TPA: DUF971 domain-containing protein [Polyangiaceae bacterium]
MAHPQPLRPTAIKAPHGARELEIHWSDGHRCHFPHSILRGFCPCAGCQGHTGAIRFQAGGNLELSQVEQVGNYALGLGWGDGHASGIYTFSYLRKLCELLEQQGADELQRIGFIPRS